MKKERFHSQTQTNERVANLCSERQQIEERLKQLSWLQENERQLEGELTKLQIEPENNNKKKKKNRNSTSGNEAETNRNNGTRQQ